MHHQQAEQCQAAAQFLQVEQRLLAVVQAGSVERQHVPCPAGVLPALVGRQPRPDACAGRISQSGGVLRGHLMQGI